LENVDIGILWPFGIFYWHLRYFNDYLVHFMFIWYIFPCFGITYKEKSGNPGLVYVIYFFQVFDFTRMMTQHFDKERRQVGLHGLYTKYQKYVTPLAANYCLQVSISCISVSAEKFNGVFILNFGQKMQTISFSYGQNSFFCLLTTSILTQSPHELW
jgi:hypothetical protein